MPEEPVPPLIRLTLRTGTVFYCKDRRLTSPEPHYFVVINANPLGDRLLLLSVATSKVEKLKRFRSGLPGTVVEILPEEYADFTVATAIDGNTVWEQSLDEFIRMTNRREVRHHKDLAPALVDRIRRAVQASPLVDQATKDLL